MRKTFLRLGGQRCSITQYGDDVNGACHATRYLLAQGHRRIGFIGNTQLPWFKRCGEGYARARAEVGTEPQYADLRSDGSQLGYPGTKLVFGRSPAPTAIFAGSDPAAAGVYSALRELRLSVPGDVSVVGFNDTQGELMSPTLTSVERFRRNWGGIWRNSS